jgi:hypothetical protein
LCPLLHASDRKAPASGVADAKRLLWPRSASFNSPGHRTLHNRANRQVARNHRQAQERVAQYVIPNAAPVGMEYCHRMLIRDGTLHRSGNVIGCSESEGIWTSPSCSRNEDFTPKQTGRSVKIPDRNFQADVEMKMPRDSAKPTARNQIPTA